MKPLIALAALVALSQPLGALAAENPATETTAIVSKSLQSRSDFVIVSVPKALTADQINAGYQLELDTLFNVTPGFLSP